MADSCLEYVVGSVPRSELVELWLGLKAPRSRQVTWRPAHATSFWRPAGSPSRQPQIDLADLARPDLHPLPNRPVPVELAEQFIVAGR